MKINFKLSPNRIKYYNIEQKNFNKTKLNFLGTQIEDTFEYSKQQEEKQNPLFNELQRKGNIIRYVNQDICAGETLADENNAVFELLPKSGVETVIDLREFDENYKDKCRAFGIKYISIPMTHILNDKKDYVFDFQNNCVNDDFVDDITLLLNLLKKGNAYLGCQYGVDRTNFALTLDYIFNYETNHKPPKIYPSNYTTRNALKNKNINLTKKILKKLSKEQREKLGIDNNFENEILPKRIGNIIKENNAPVSSKIVNLIEKKTGYYLEP